MFWSAETPYEQIRNAQREMRERAARAQLLARVRREANEARRAEAGRFTRAAQRMRSARVRP